MITTIARKEFIEMFRDGRFRWAAFIVLALLAVALVAGGYYQRELVAQQRAAQAAEQARWYAQDPKNPHAAAHYGLYAFKPRLAPAFLDPGVEPYTGVAVWLEAHKQNEMLFRPGEDATLAQRFGDLTVALVLQIVLPLVIILVAFNAFAGERERGTLRQLLSLGLRPRDLVLGKMLGLGGALALMAAPAVLLGIATLALTGPAEGAPRFALLVFIYLLYLGIFLLLALAVSARAPSSVSRSCSSSASGASTACLHRAVSPTLPLRFIPCQSRFHSKRGCKRPWPIPLKCRPCSRSVPPAS